MILHLSHFKNKSDNRPRPIQTGWGALRGRLTRHEERVDKDGPLWSPARYRRGATRGNAGVIDLCCFIGDVDDGTPPSVLIERWQGLTWCLYSTHSSRADCPKWRIVFPLAAPVQTAEWGQIWRRLTFHLLDGHNDPACKDRAHMFYLPAAPPQTIAEAFADLADGELLDPGKFADPPELEAAARLAAFIERKPLADFQGRKEGRAGDDYSQHASLGEIAGMLLRAGWQEHTDRGEGVYLTRPGKNDGVSGVVRPDRSGAGLVFYVFTSSAPPFEAGKAYDAFGVYARLRHGGRFMDAAKDLVTQGFGHQRAAERMGTARIEGART